VVACLSIRYDLKQGKPVVPGHVPVSVLCLTFCYLVEISKSPASKVPPELAKHEAAQHKISREMKRKRDADDMG